MVVGLQYDAGKSNKKLGKLISLFAIKSLSKAWFGAFAFGDGNPYKPGRFGFIKIDLVFRTYIGKTPEQVALEQKNLRLIISD